MEIALGALVLFIIVLIMSISGNKKVNRLEKEEPINKYIGDKY